MTDATPMDATNPDALADLNAQLTAARAEVEALRRYEQTHIANLDEFRDAMSGLLSSLGEGPGSPAMTPDEWVAAIHKGINAHIDVLVGLRTAAEARATQAEAERDALNERIAEAERRLRMAAPWSCPTCGPHIKIDQDACCVTCGADAAYNSEADDAAVAAFEAGEQKGVAEMRANAEEQRARAEQAEQARDSFHREIASLRVAYDDLQLELHRVVQQYGERANKAEQALADCQREREALRGALEFYADPFGRVDDYGDPVSVPDFYREMDFGARARGALTPTPKDGAR